MKIVVLGATGPSGLQVVEQALAAGHEVTAYVRQQGKLPAGVTVTLGQLADVPGMTAAFTGADAVISCLGIKRDLGAILGKPDLISTSTPAITAALVAAGVDRFVVLSAFGVGASRAKASGLGKLVYSAVLGRAFADKEKAEAGLATSDLAWTLAYPVTLTNGPRTGTAVVTELSATPTVGGLPKISRADVATVLLAMAVDGTFVRQTAVITV